MKHTLLIDLTEAEVREAIYDAALRRVDLGVPFSESDMQIVWLSETSGARIELIPQRTRFEELSPEVHVVPAALEVVLDSGNVLGDEPF